MPLLTIVLIQAWLQWEYSVVSNHRLIAQTRDDATVILLAADPSARSESGIQRGT
jgi:hypothetical protein